MQKKEYEIKPGNSYPLGCKHNGGGANFSIFSRYATDVELLLFETTKDNKPFRTITLQKDINRTFFYWHVYIVGLPVGSWYTWRIDGSNLTHENGFSFDKEKQLIDPWPVQ